MLARRHRPLFPVLCSFSTGSVSFPWHCHCCPWIRHDRRAGEKRYAGQYSNLTFRPTGFEPFHSMLFWGSLPLLHRCRSSFSGRQAHMSEEVQYIYRSIYDVGTVNFIRGFCLFSESLFITVFWTPVYWLAESTPTPLVEPIRTARLFPVV